MSFCSIAFSAPLSVWRFAQCCLWTEPESFMLYQLFPLEILHLLLWEFKLNSTLMLSTWGPLLLESHLKRTGIRENSFSVLVGNSFERSMSACFSSYIICLLRKIQGSEAREDMSGGLGSEGMLSFSLRVSVLQPWTTAWRGPNWSLPSEPQTQPRWVSENGVFVETETESIFLCS